MVTAVREFGLIGYPLGHSFSKEYFTRKFIRENIPATYELFSMRDLSDLGSFIEKHPCLDGFNVTIPYKQAILDYIEGNRQDCLEIGAVNVIKIKREGGKRILYGFNTDVIGFRNSLTPLLPTSVSKALVLGSGGASKAVVYVLKTLGIRPVIVSRTPDDGRIGYDELDDNLVKECGLIVNCTPLGMYPETDACPPIPYSSISHSALCYDLIYNPAVTMFMKKCAEAGTAVKNGLEMLYRQAEASWEIWNHDDAAV